MANNYWEYMRLKMIFEWMFDASMLHFEFQRTMKVYIENQNQCKNNKNVKLNCAELL